MPAWTSRSCSHSGDGAAGSMPRTMRVTKRSHPATRFSGAASSTSTGKPSGVAAGTAPPGRFSGRPGSVNAAPVAWEYSRATPRMEKQ